MVSKYREIADADRVPELLADSICFPVLAESVGVAQAGEIALNYVVDHYQVTDAAGVVHKFHGPASNLAIGAKGSLASIKVAEVLKSALSGATVTATGIFPAKTFHLGVAVYVTTLITGASSFDVGDGSDADRYANDVAVAAGTDSDNSDATADPTGWDATAGDVVLTAVGSNFTAGAVRIAAFYLDYSGPTA